jgi:hypothetical protein
MYEREKVGGNGSIYTRQNVQKKSCETERLGLNVYIQATPPTILS